MFNSLCLVFILFIIIDCGYLYPKPDLNIHLHIDGTKAVGDEQKEEVSRQINRALKRMSKILFYI